MIDDASRDVSVKTEGHLAAGQAALMALEALMLTLSYKRILKPEEVVEAIEITIEAKRNILQDGESPKILEIAVGMLKKVANSVAAVEKPEAPPSD